MCKPDLPNFHFSLHLVICFDPPNPHGYTLRDDLLFRCALMALGIFWGAFWVCITSESAAPARQTAPPCWAPRAFGWPSCGIAWRQNGIYCHHWVVLVGGFLAEWPVVASICHFVAFILYGDLFGPEESNGRANLWRLFAIWWLIPPGPGV